MTKGVFAGMTIEDWAFNQFQTVSAEAVQAFFKGAIAYENLKEIMEECGIKEEEIIYACCPQSEGLFCVDYKKVLCLLIEPEAKLRDIRISMLTFASQRGKIKASSPIEDRLEQVPVSMQPLFFKKNLKSFSDEKVFSVWYRIYKRISYDNGIWDLATMEYILNRAPDFEKPDVDENGFVTVYRGIGTKSKPADQAISWSSDPTNALFFAAHKEHGEALLTGKVHVSDVVYHTPGFYEENEVLVWPERVQQVKRIDMFSARNYSEIVEAIGQPATFDYSKYRNVPYHLGYPKEGLFSYHGCGHIRRVLLLVLCLYHHDQNLSHPDKEILMWFALLHDIGRTDEGIDRSHGTKSVSWIEENEVEIAGLQLIPQQKRIANLLIEYHCWSDEDGEEAIMNQNWLSKDEKEHVIRLDRIAKDADGLDRVRFNGLDYKQLRTAYAKKLPIVAGHLAKVITAYKT